MPIIRFEFKDYPDKIGGYVCRPVATLRIDGAEPRTYLTAIVDTGSPDTCIAWEEAERAGIDPAKGEPIVLPAGYAVGGAPVEDARGFERTCWIQDDRHFIRLLNAPILFVKPWVHPGFRGVLGTRAMHSVRLEVSVYERWLRFTPESET